MKPEDLTILLAIGVPVAGAVGVLLLIAGLLVARDRSREKAAAERASAEAAAAAERASAEAAARARSEFDRRAAEDARAAEAARAMALARQRLARVLEGRRDDVDIGSVILRADEQALWSTQAHVWETSRREGNLHPLGQGTVVLTTSGLIANGLRIPFSKIVEPLADEHGLRLHLEWSTRPLVVVTLSAADAWFVASAITALARQVSAQSPA